MGQVLHIVTCLPLHPLLIAILWMRLIKLETIHQRQLPQMQLHLQCQHQSLSALLLIVMSVLQVQPQIMVQQLLFVLMGPRPHGYIRFLVLGMKWDTNTRATLIVHKHNILDRYPGDAVSDTTWGEKTVNYNDKPVLGNLLGSSGAMSSNSWVSMDVTPYLTGDGLFSFGIQTLSSSAMSLQSREAIPTNLNLSEFGNPPPTDIASVNPGNVNASVAGTTEIDLSWTASTDNVGVTGYDVFRNSVLINTVPATMSCISRSKSYTSHNLHYSLDAFDQAGNHSTLSSPISATTNPLPDNQAPTIPGGLSAFAQATPQLTFHGQLPPIMWV